MAHRPRGQEVSLRFRRIISHSTLLLVSALALVGASAAEAKPKCDWSSKGNTPIWRVDSPDDVAGWRSLSRHIEDRDIFLINTRQDGLLVRHWTRTAKRLKRAFPCNRIMALNGLHHNPTRRGYYAALTDFDELWGAAVDFERMDWDWARWMGANVMGPKLGRWVPENIPLTTERFRKAIVKLAEKSKAPFVGAFPSGYGGWNHGQFNKLMMDSSPGKGTLYSLQTQVPCERGQTIFEDRINALRDEHRGVGLTFHQIPGFGTTRMVGLQISFTHEPEQPDPPLPYPLPMKTMPVGKAVLCTGWANLTSRQTILYWTEPESAKVFFSRPLTACYLRKRCS